MARLAGTGRTVGGVGVVGLRHPGAPAAGTFPGVPTGALCTDTTAGVLYQNSGTPAAPVWGKVGVETVAADEESARDNGGDDNGGRKPGRRRGH